MFGKMHEGPNLQLPCADLSVQEAKETQQLETAHDLPRTRYQKWLQMALFSILVLAGQSAATLLGRLYFEKGGKSKWMSTLVQAAGFPVLIPILFVIRNKGRVPDEKTKPPSPLVLGSVYIVLGILLAAICMLFTIGLLYLPVSTFSLLSATQLAFNAIFSYFLNSQKFTTYIINSVVLLTTSSALLVLQGGSLDNNEVSKGKYIAGTVCTLCASAGYSLMLSLSQLAFLKVMRKPSVKELLDFLVYESLVASCIILIGLFASGEWKTLKAEVNGYELGKGSYVLTLIWIALCWQIFSIGMLGLIVKASALFANVISTLCLPIVPMLAVFIFQDKMSGVKAVSMFLAIWGFISYLYQHYLDDLKSKTISGNDIKEPEISMIRRE